MKKKRIKWVFKWLIGKCRLFFGFCPECNSDAPEMSNCFVCSNGLLNLFHNTEKNAKNILWERFINLNQNDTQ